MRKVFPRGLKLGFLALSATLLLAGCGDDDNNSSSTVGTADLSSLETLGKKLFFDENLSSPAGQSCATCHAPETGFSGPRSAINAAGAVYPGAADSPAEPRFGNRKPPTAAYATVSPMLHFDTGEELFIGGNFWDGRATGEQLGNPAADQALGPFLNPVEQNLASAREVCEIVAASSYAHLFAEAFPAISSPVDCVNDVAGTYDRVGLAIAAYEDSPEVNAFTSKYDYYLKGMVELTPLEEQGLALFEGKAQCNLCHPSALGPEGELPLFTDFSYDNLGVPANPENPFYQMDQLIIGGSPFNPQGANWVDEGLGAFLAGRDATLDGTGTGTVWADRAADNLGKQKVPTLRNVDKRPSADFVKAYAHNGYFKSLKEIVHFYNTRDVLPVCNGTGTAGVDCWPAPEVAANVNDAELGNLGLTEAEEEAVVAFMKTLSDGYQP